MVPTVFLQTPSRSHNKERCTVENLNTSLFYNVQIQCVTNEKCTLCPWSEIYTIPPGEVVSWWERPVNTVMSWININYTITLMYNSIMWFKSGFFLHHLVARTGNRSSIWHFLPHFVLYSNCPLSELTTRPVLVKHEDTDIAGQRGTRLLSLKWKVIIKMHLLKILSDCKDFNLSKRKWYYYNRVCFISIPPKGCTTATLWRSVNPPESLHVSCWASLSLRSHSFSPTPATSCTSVLPTMLAPPRLWAGPYHGESSFPVCTHCITVQCGIEFKYDIISSIFVSTGAEAKLTVSVRSSTSLALHWKDDLIKTYVCYSAEWSKKGHKTVAMSFYQNKMNNKTLSPLPGTVCVTWHLFWSGLFCNFLSKVIIKDFIY